MKNSRELLDIYRGRFDETMRSALEPTDDIRAGLLRLAVRNSVFWYRDQGEEKLYRLAIRKDAEETLDPFRDPRKGLFANKVDYSVSWSVLLWAIRLFSWAAERNDWKPVREHSVTLESLFAFFEEADYAWIKTGQAGLLEARFKDEYPFVVSGEVWYPSPLNALWTAFLCLFNVFCNRTGNLRFASRTQDVLDSLMESFHGFFWDSARSETAVLVHPDRDRKVFSGHSVFLPAYDPAGILFKNRKKKMLDRIERQYYTERGLRVMGETAEPSLIPVYCEALLAFYGSSGRTITRVEKLLTNHASFIDPITFAKGDAEYERGMVSVLRAIQGMK